MYLDGLIKIIVVALLLAHYARAGNLTNQEIAGKVAKRELSPSLQRRITNALYVAAIFIPSKEDPTRIVCSGFFLHEFWVLTAASCFDGRKVIDRKAVVIFGVDDYTAETVNRVVSMHVWLHPDYDAPTKMHDIALIKLPQSNKVQMDKSKIVDATQYLYTPGYFWYRYPHHKNDNTCIALGFAKKFCSMAAVGNLSEHDCVKAMTLLEEGYSQREVARRLGVHHSSIGRTLK
uniref:Uncharacterized protein n=1 Tax=Rhodnius prolixus TaxID=13249 RepID=T1IFJ3_RHOPR